VNALKEHFGERMCVKEGVYDQEYNRFWNKCKIGINCSPFGEATVRIYEVLATGTALVTDRGKDLESIFDDGEHLLMYDSLDDAISCCEALLSDPDKRERLAENGPAVLRWNDSSVWLPGIT
jgi:spore maturation protein CgeB